MSGNEIDWRGAGDGRVPGVRRETSRPTAGRPESEPRRAVEAEEVLRVLGANSWSAESLLYNPDNGVTRGVWRVSAADREPVRRDGWSLPDRAVLKLVSSRPWSDGRAWQPSEEPRSWSYWRREVEVYQSDVPFLGDETGLKLPGLLDVFERPEEDGHLEASIWLEDVDGTPGEDFSLAQHAQAAEALGRFHARALQRPELLARRWSSRCFLRDYSGHRPVRLAVLEDDELWADDLVRQTLGPEVRDAARKLVSSRDSLLKVLEGLPQVFSHLDFWPRNLVQPADAEEVVAFDWGFCGQGALGEDLGNYVPDCVMDHYVAAEDLEELDRRTWAAYLRGLADGGWSGDRELLRLGVCATAVKYHWLLPSMLEALRSGEARTYGGGPVSDPVLQFEERGRAVVFLAGWVDEALALAFP